MTLPRGLYFYATAALMEAVVFTFVLTVPLDAVARFDATALELGVLGLLCCGGYAVVAWVAGARSDRRGRRGPMLVAVVGQITLALLLPLAPSLAVLMALGTLQYVVVGCFWAPFLGLFSEKTTPRRLPAALALFNISWCAGGVAVSLLNSRVLAHFGDTRAPYAVAGLLALPVLAGIALARPRELREPEGEAPPRHHPRVTWFKGMAWLTLTAAFFMLGMLFYVFPKVAEGLPVPLPPDGVAQLHAWRQGAMLITFALLGVTSGWRFRMAPIHVAYGLLVGLVLALGFVESFALLRALFAGLGCAAALAYALSAYYSMLEPAKGSNMGMHEALLSTGSTLGPIFGGWLMFATGRAGLTFALATLPLLAVWAVAIYFQRGGRLRFVRFWRAR